MNMKRRDTLTFISCPGSRIHTHYEPVYDGHSISLVETGVTDTQEAIESYAKYTDLHFMLHRLSRGDTSVLSSRPPLYGDFSGLPNNPVDVINLVHNAEKEFGELSAEERAKYNNNYLNWISSVLNGSTSEPIPDTDSTVPTSLEKEDVKE